MLELPKFTSKRACTGTDRNGYTPDGDAESSHRRSRPPLHRAWKHCMQEAGRFPSCSSTQWIGLQLESAGICRAGAPFRRPAAPEAHRRVLAMVRMLVNVHHDQQQPAGGLHVARGEPHGAVRRERAERARDVAIAAQPLRCRAA